MNKNLIPLEVGNNEQYLHVRWTIGDKIVRIKVLMVFFVFDFDKGLVMVHGGN